MLLPGVSFVEAAVLCVRPLRVMIRTAVSSLHPPQLLARLLRLLRDSSRLFPCVLLCPEHKGECVDASGRARPAFNTAGVLPGFIFALRVDNK